MPLRPTPLRPTPLRLYALRLYALRPYAQRSYTQEIRPWAHRLFLDSCPCSFVLARAM